MEKATFGAGCFWGIEAAFRQVHGVKSTAVGFMGGTLQDPTYEELLGVFWENHDPTTLNRQGPDVGTQYRSAIFFHTPEQEASAKASADSIARSGRYKRP